MARHCRVQPGRRIRPAGKVIRTFPGATFSMVRLCEIPGDARLEGAAGSVAQIAKAESTGGQAIRHERQYPVPAGGLRTLGPPPGSRAHRAPTGRTISRSARPPPPRERARAPPKAAKPGGRRKLS
jgi:hypothetical protein